MSTKKLNTRIIRQHKIRKGLNPLQMLTCYDYQTASLLNETQLDMILVGDSLGNVILGYETTVQVSLEEMKIFSSAVKRGAKDKFVIADMPFGSYASFENGLNNAIDLFQTSNVEAIKLEGASAFHMQLIERLTQTGIPVMGHIGLTPQSVHEMGGYYTHGKDETSAKKLVSQALSLQDAGVFSIVLECVSEDLSRDITKALSIPTIGIGAGTQTDGQVLVINDLLHLGKNDPPKFCQPIDNLFQYKKSLIEKYLAQQKSTYVGIDHCDH